MTLICASILVHDEAAALADVFAARDAGADMVEIRIDEFFTGDEPERETRAIVRLLARSPLPCVVTCRLASEGGGFSGDEADRIAMLERICNPTAERVADGAGNSVAEHPPRYIDVEAAAFAKATWTAPSSKRPLCRALRVSVSVLIAVVLAINAFAYGMRGWAERRWG